jgi:hypothetical protein
MSSLSIFFTNNFDLLDHIREALVRNIVKSNLDNNWLIDILSQQLLTVY